MFNSFFSEMYSLLWRYYLWKKKEFEIEIISPFKKSEIKTSSIEKIQPCVSNQTVLNISEQETIIFNNYNPLIIQKDYITSFNLVRNYSTTEYLEQKRINVIINGMLIFTSFKYDLTFPFILYIITQKNLFIIKIIYGNSVIIVFWKMVELIIIKLLISK